MEKNNYPLIVCLQKYKFDLGLKVFKKNSICKI